jgi:hypothetical protein
LCTSFLHRPEQPRADASPPDEQGATHRVESGPAVVPGNQGFGRVQCQRHHTGENEKAASQPDLLGARATQYELARPKKQRHD